MHNTRVVKNNVYWIGGDDQRIERFENMFPVEYGMAYNSYLILDEKVTILDTVDHSVSRQFYENIEYLVQDQKIDYLVVQHMEPDHCSCIQDLLLRYPEITIVCNQKTQSMMKQFFTFEPNVHLVKQGDTLSLGSNTLEFMMAPMVHWPEVMMTYAQEEKILFSADAFGSFDALNGNLFSSDISIQHDWLDQGRRYYSNIVGKFGMQVQNVLKKAAQMDIEMICPLHGVIWNQDLEYLLEKYNTWSTYTPEENSVCMMYASVYGNTENMVSIVANRLGAKGIKNIKMFDVSKTDVSYLVSAIFRCKTIVLASPTYNMQIFPKMDNLLHDLIMLGIKNRTIGIIDNGSWANTAGKQIREKIETMKNMTIIEPILSVTSSVKEQQEEQITQFVEQIIDSLN